MISAPLRKKWEILEILNFITRQKEKGPKQVRLR
jgi:hypothetical protein